MKKLLLVMLVPVMVLGLMGCGKIYNGQENPVCLQGAWSDTETLFAFVVTGNQATVFRPYDAVAETFGNVAFRTNYLGDEKGALDSNEEFTIEFYLFDQKETKIGEIQCRFSNGYQNGTDPADDVIYVEESIYEKYYSNYIIPPKGTYNRTLVQEATP